MTTKIFLVMIDPKTEAETHMEWEGHEKLEDAMREYAEIRSMSMKEGINPIDGYVYEAEQPPFGIKAEKLDMAKFASFFENTIMSESMNNSYSYDVVR